MDFWLVIIVISGLIWGSFLTALKSRLDSIESLLTGRSMCPRCKHELSWLDLIPLFSYIFQRGKCRYCKKSISWQYPVIEISSVLLAIIFYLKSGISISSVLAYVAASLLLIASILDIESQEVPTNLLISSVLISLISYSIVYYSEPLIIIISGFSCALIPAILSFFSREKWMGYGDVLFALAVGFITGFPASVISIFLAFIIGSIFGIIYLIKTKKNFSSRIRLPFGPFIAFGGLIGFMYGQELFLMYLRLIGF